MSTDFQSGKAVRSRAIVAASAAFLALSVLAPQVVAMPADAQNPDNAESVAIGREAAQEWCARCHAIGRTGASPNKASPPLRAVAHKYRDKSISSILIIDGTVVEHRGMPRFEVPVEKADGLIAYIRSLDSGRR
ncbi:MAG: cytochrome c [Beijerinckiaceae bacterium]|nr:cytochrome c [Beijerinckiaceae bacterium]